MIIHMLIESDNSLKWKKNTKNILQIEIKNNAIFDFKYVYPLKYYNIDTYLKMRNSKNKIYDIQICEKAQSYLENDSSVVVDVISYIVVVVEEILLPMEASW